MKKFISFPKIGQFKNVIKTINDRVRYDGVDENGDAIFNRYRELPTLTFKGTVKLHGTNAGVSFNREDGMWAQSRKNIITVENDNAGFAFFVDTNKSIFQKLFDELNDEIHFKDTDIITIFGEWFGGNIQKGVAINGLPKSFSIFAVKVTPIEVITNPESKVTAYFLNESVYSKLKSPDNNIYNTVDFENWIIEIDFNKPAEIQNKLIELTELVEKQCPVGKAFGNDGIGEGIVWVHQSEDYDTLRFKVKGEKHSSSKVKKLAPVDTEKLNSINEFLDFAVTENRLNQALEVVFTMNNEDIDIKKMGEFLKWIMSDIIAEESDVLAKSNLEPKDIGKSVSNKARKWFLEKWNKIE